MYLCVCVSISDRADYGDTKAVASLPSTSVAIGGTPEVSSLLSANTATATTSGSHAMAFSLSSTAKDTRGAPRKPPTSFNADDFFVMKASSECKSVLYTEHAGPFKFFCMYNLLTAQQLTISDHMSSSLYVVLCVVYGHLGTTFYS